MPPWPSVDVSFIALHGREVKMRELLRLLACGVRAEPCRRSATPIVKVGIEKFGSGAVAITVGDM